MLLHLIDGHICVIHKLTRVMGVKRHAANTNAAGKHLERFFPVSAVQVIDLLAQVFRQALRSACILVGHQNSKFLAT